MGKEKKNIAYLLSGYILIKMTRLLHIKLFSKFIGYKCSNKMDNVDNKLSILGFWKKHC